jgi:protein phosphatase 1 regulatory subunit 42
VKNKKNSNDVRMQRRRKEEPDEKFLGRLTHINLSDKKLDRIENLDLCNALACLYLYDNKISKIENLSFALNLTHLYVQDNNIRYVLITFKS